MAAIPLGVARFKSKETHTPKKLKAPATEKKNHHSWLVIIGHQSTKSTEPTRSWGYWSSGYEAWICK